MLCGDDDCRVLNDGDGYTKYVYTMCVQGEKGD